MYDVLEGLAKSLVGLGGGGRARYTVLRLTDVLGLSEEGGEAPVDLYERASRPLIPRSAPSREALRAPHVAVSTFSCSFISCHRDQHIQEVRNRALKMWGPWGGPERPQAR